MEGKIEIKRSRGVTIFGAYFIIYSIIDLLAKCLKLYRFHNWLVYENIVGDFILLILAVKVLELMDWSRKGLIYYSIFTPIFSLLTLILILKTYSYFLIFLFFQNVTFSLVVIYFFTRQKVKEQFK